MVDNEGMLLEGGNGGDKLVEDLHGNWWLLGGQVPLVVVGGYDEAYFVGGSADQLCQRPLCQFSQDLAVTWVPLILKGAQKIA